MTNAPLFSLILPTLHRIETLPRLLESLCKQTTSNYEIIVVDQNSDERVTEILEPYLAILHIRHVRCSPGLSFAKNTGLAIAKGTYCMFPDDDCWFPPTLLEDVQKEFEKVETDFLCFIATDEQGTPILPFSHSDGIVTRDSIWRQCCAISFVAKTEILRSVGGFHFDFGLGSRWPSGEDMELPIRLLSQGYSGYYLSSLYIYHPTTEDLAPQELLKRVKKYAPAAGRIWRIHNYSFFYVMYHLLRPLMGCIMALLKGNFSLFSCRYSACLGRMKGWLTKNEVNQWPSPITFKKK